MSQPRKREKPFQKKKKISIICLALSQERKRFDPIELNLDDIFVYQIKLDWIGSLLN